jgi:hypothetical protein
VSFPDPRNRRAFEWHVDHVPPETLPEPALKDEILEWQRWLLEQEAARKSRKKRLRSKAARGTVRWGGIGASGLGLIALAVTPLGAPVAILGAMVTATGEIVGFREEVRAAQLAPAIQRVQDRLSHLERVLDGRAL